MSKIQNNPIMKGVSGMLGDVVVYRKHRDGLVMANRPKKRDTLTPKQEQAKTRFLTAVQYAKKQMADPVAKAEYTPGPNSQFNSAYAAAVADYLKAPKINNIDASKYHGALNDTLQINASDNFKVTNVHVAIYRADKSLIEQGDATPLDIGVNEYIYKATQANAAVVGSKVIVTVRDKPGNIVTEEKVL
jgi:hypothetical protein